MMIWSDYRDRWNAAPFVKKYTEDDLSWQQFIVSQRKDNPNVITMDFAVVTKYESAFRNGARNAGYSTSVLNRKSINYEGSRGECTTDASLIEVRFTGWSTTSWCLLAVVVSVGLISVIYREPLKKAVFG